MSSPSPPASELLQRFGLQERTAVFNANHQLVGILRPDLLEPDRVAVALAATVVEQVVHGHPSSGALVQVLVNHLVQFERIEDGLHRQVILGDGRIAAVPEAVNGYVAYNLAGMTTVQDPDLNACLVTTIISLTPMWVATHG